MNSGCAGRDLSHRQNHISSEHLVSAKYSQSLHNSGILIFQDRELLASYCDFNPALFCREKQGCVCASVCVCELEHTGNQGPHHKATAEMQSVDLFQFLAINRWQRQAATQPRLGSAHPSGQRHTGMWALIGLVHPSKKRHENSGFFRIIPMDRDVGTQAQLGSAHPRAQQGRRGRCLPQYSKRLHTNSLTQGWAFMASLSP